MARARALVVGAFVGALGLTLIAADRPPDDYANHMKNFGTALQTLVKAVQADDFDEAIKNVTVIIDGLPAIRAFWDKRSDAQDAVTFVQAAQKSAGDLRVAANLKSGEGVAYSLKELTGNCGGCHSAHRDKAADGSFLIK
jgi:cytochrome c556